MYIFHFQSNLEISDKIWHAFIACNYELIFLLHYAVTFVNPSNAKTLTGLLQFSTRYEVLVSEY